MESRSPSLTRGCVTLGVAYAARYGVPSFVAALPLIALFALASAAERAGVPELAGSAGLGFFGVVAVDYALETLQAGLAALVLVMTIRRVARGGDAGGALSHEIAQSVRAPLVRTAVRSGWVVLALLAALYVLLAATGAVLAGGGPGRVLLLPVFLIVMPLTTGGPLGLLAMLLAVAALTILLGLLGLYVVRNTLLHSGAEAAAELPVFRPALDRPFAMVRLVFNLTWLYGMPFMLLYEWVPRLIFPASRMPRFADVEAQISGGVPAAQTAFSTEMLLRMARGVYEGGAIGVGLILVALAALVMWNQAAAIVLNRSGAGQGGTPQAVTRADPWHDPDTALKATIGTPPRGTFGRRAR